jgi:hypothetical protein
MRTPAPATQCNGRSVKLNQHHPPPTSEVASSTVRGVLSSIYLMAWSRDQPMACRPESTTSRTARWGGGQGSKNSAHKDFIAVAPKVDVGVLFKR